MYTGSCLCGSINFSINGKITDIIQDESSILFYFGKDKFYILPLQALTKEQKQNISLLHESFRMTFLLHTRRRRRICKLGQMRFEGLLLIRAGVDEL